MRTRIWAVALGLAVAAATVAATPAAADASCAVMTLEVDQSGALSLVPSSVTVNDGGCVQFSNQTIFAARFSVGGYSQTVPAFSQTSGTGNYTAQPGGVTQTVTASEAGGRASGKIVVRPATKPSPSPSRTGGGPAPHQSSPSSSRPRPTPAATTTSPVPVHSSPATSPSRTAKPPAQHPVKTPTPSTSSFLSGQPTPSPEHSSVAVVSGPLQPPTDRGTGLPAALAALAVVATAGALLRVLLAEPVPAVHTPLSGRSRGVDGPHSVGARP